ncbi:MAG: ABC transporter permease [Acidobacteriia bacterium]|nr:ABC transporter permease [Terriglobia bacterium]
MRLFEAKEIVAMALDSLRKSKMRSALTILGIVIGVMTVIAVTSVIRGLNATVTSQIEEIGSNIIFVYRFNWATLGRIPNEVFQRKELTFDDAMAIKEVPGVTAVDPALRLFRPDFGAGTFSARYEGNLAKNAILQGDYSGSRDVWDLKIYQGRWFTDYEDEHRSPVVVLGYDTAQTLFPNLDPIGREIDAEGTKLIVIGVAEKRKQGLGGGANPEDNILLLPLGTFRKLHPEYKDFLISIRVQDQALIPEVIDRVEEVLRRRRRVPPGKPDDFAIFTQDAFSDLWNQVSSGVFTVMGLIAGISLLVGGVGVMNIMLVSVTERTREIGVRKAIGARKRDILWQFVLEAMTLTAVGGVIGILVGSTIAFVLRLFLPSLPAEVSVFWLLAGLSTSITVGLIFGIYPAWKAANLNPIDALRYE